MKTKPAPSPSIRLAVSLALFCLLPFAARPRPLVLCFSPSGSWLWRLVLCLLPLAFSLQPSAFAQGTAFTYQGRLNDGGSPANGSNDFTFAVFAAPVGGLPLAGPIKVDDVAVGNGLFTCAVDFGSGIFTGADRWLEIGVRPGDSGGGYTNLSPRQKLTATPYAIYAGEAATATYAATTLWTGVNGVPPGFADGVDNDTTYGAGLGLSLIGTNFSLDPLYTDGRYWTLFGNSGTSAGANFLGTTDNQPLEMKVNNTRALRLEPQPISPNVIGGHGGNGVGSSAYGATIGGGGTAAEPNLISAIFSTVGGGLGHTIQANAWNATIGGGKGNTIQNASRYATIGGGAENTIEPDVLNGAIGGGWSNTIQKSGQSATIAGGNGNVVTGANSSVGGGQWNSAQGDWSTVAGGRGNLATGRYATVSGGGIVDGQGATGPGDGNRALGDFATVGGGAANWANGTNSTVGGGFYNTIQTNAVSSTISGGQDNWIQTTAHYAAIGGGFNNTIEPGTLNSTIGGGFSNIVQGSSASGTIGGGNGNTIWSFARNSLVGGGYANVNKANESVIGGGMGNFLDDASAWNTISGGQSNRISFGVGAGTIAGGRLNALGSDCDYSAIGGGQYNAIGLPGFGTSVQCTIGGGYGNFISPNSQYDVISGGRSNTVQTNCYYATIPGGLEAAAASYGQFAHASGGFDHVRGSAQASEYLLRNRSTNNATFELYLNGGDGVTSRMVIPTNSVWTFLMHVSALSESGNDFAAYEVRGVVSTVGSIFLQMRDGASASVSTAPPIYETVGAATWQATPYVDVPSQQIRIAVNGGSGQVVRWLARVQTTEVLR